MADEPIIVRDEEGHARHFRLPRGAGADLSAPAPGAARSPQAAAEAFLQANAALLELPPLAVRAIDLPPGLAPADDQVALRFEAQKPLMDTTVVSFSQTVFGLPIYQAGISVTTSQPDNNVTAAQSELRYDVVAEKPGDSLVSRHGVDAGAGGYDALVRKALGAPRGLRINQTRLIVYRYDAGRRATSHSHAADEASFASEPPTLPLPAIPATIREGVYYPVVEVLFSLPLDGWGLLTWRAFIEPESGTVLYLRALVDGATGLVFDRDPVTKSGSAANNATATAAVLDTFRDSVTLQNLAGTTNGTQSLSGTFVRIQEVTLPTVAGPTTTSPFNFAYGSRTNNFAAVNGYYHCDRFFRTVRDLGFSIATYFDGTSFPVAIDHRGKGTASDGGNIVNADCRPNGTAKGIGSVNFALASVADTANPIGIATDARVVLHELGGHGILYDHVGTANFGFAHSAGDSVAALFHDPDTNAPDRFLTFPFTIAANGQPLNRRHDRPVNGWGWGSANDDKGYGSEQLLSTIHFRVYRSIGGDSTWQPNRLFASRATMYLILRGVGQLTQGTNPSTPLAWEQQLETADAGTWNSTAPAETNAGGAYHKVIRWSFEKQGLFRSAGTPVTGEGKPPAVDVYIDDGRHGEYPYLANHWSCTDIWNRRTAGDGGGVHEEPVVGQTNFAYVRIKNRGTQSATGIVVKGFHALPGVGLVYPTDWVAMTTPQLGAPNLAAGDATGEVVGPFQWTPSQVGHECMFFSVSATGDKSNIDGGLTGPIQEWRLVPNDNNIGQRNVHPVDGGGLDKVDWAKLPFWIRNNNRKLVTLGYSVKLPTWLARLGWTFAIPTLDRGRPSAKPGERVKVALAVKPGKPVTADAFRRGKDPDIVVTVLHDGLAVGGMTFRMTPPKG